MGIGDAVGWVPPMDVFEIDDDYVLNAELPGVDRRDIRIDFSDTGFTIRGERKPGASCCDEHYHRLEGHRGRFHRTFSLPEPIDRGRIKLDMKDGVLHLVLPKLGGRRGNH